MTRMWWMWQAWTRTVWGVWGLGFVWDEMKTKKEEDVQQMRNWVVG